MIWTILGLSLLSGILYRFGGSGKRGNSLDFLRDTITRDLGCPTCATGLLLIFWQPVNLQGWLMVLLSFLALFGALTTYWDSVFGYDNFYAHGFMLGLAAFPLYWVGIPWWTIAIRCIVLTLGIGLWSKWTHWDILEEFGRGFILTVSVPVLLL